MMTRLKTLLTCVATMTLCSTEKLHAQEQDTAYLHTGLPVCYINYDPSVTITKEDKTDATFSLQAPGDTLNGKVKISGHGNYTWILAKKPYNLKFDKKVSLLGMAAGKKYALMANFFDPSMLRIAIGFEAGRWVGFEWPLHGRYVELVLNGKHQGNYFLAERVSQTTVKVDKDDGYILEYRYANQIQEGSVNFKTDINHFIIEFKDPDSPEVGGEMYNHAMKTMNDFEEAIFADDHFARRRWETMVDMDNFVKWYYWENLLQMDECNRYYVMENSQQGTPLKMGPLWDFDWTMGLNYNREHYDQQYMRNELFFAPLADDSVFLARVARFHLAHRQRIEAGIRQLYDSLTTQIRASAALDNKIWGAQKGMTNSWDEETAIDKAFLLNTLSYLDRQLTPYVESAGIATVEAPSPACTKFIRQGKLYIRRGNHVCDCLGRPMKP